MQTRNAFEESYKSLTKHYEKQKIEMGRVMQKAAKSWGVRQAAVDELPRLQHEEGKCVKKFQVAMDEAAKYLEEQRRRQEYVKFSAVRRRTSSKAVDRGDLTIDEERAIKEVGCMKCCCSFCTIHYRHHLRYFTEHLTHRLKSAPHRLKTAPHRLKTAQCLCRYYLLSSA